MGISSTKDWIIAINEAIPKVQKYENNLYNFYKSLGQYKSYDNSMMTGCYKKSPFSTYVPKIIFSHFVMKSVFSVIAGLFSFGAIIGNKPCGIGEALKTYGESTAILAFLIAFIALCLMCAADVGLKKLSFSSKTKALDSLENTLRPLLATIPSAYRNSDKMDAMAKIYFTKPSIDPDIFLSCVDELEPQLPRKAKFMSVMFDIPTNCPFLNMTDEKDSNISIDIGSGDESTYRSEYLPSDIDTKVMAGSEDSDKDLNSMIGLADVKKQIEHLRNRMSFYGKESGNNGNHMAFLGSAGTGKTTVARIVTKMLFDLGYIKKNQYIEISGDYLCAGNTSRASAIIEYAYGGVLFIDEAYLMYRTGSEVIGVLLKAMEDHRSDFVCILAGYEEQMTKLFASNEGFSSRVKHTIYFSDYDESEMIDIFNYFIKNYNGKSYSLETSAIPLLRDAFTFEKRAKSFGNARTVRNAVDTIMDFYADRSIAEKTDDKIIKTSEVEAYYEKRKKVLQHEIKNASAANQLDETIIRLSELKPRVKLGSENPDEDFSRLVGLDSFMEEIDSLRNQKEFYDDVVHQKILLVGPEGCGKSTLVKVLTGYLYKFGYITENKILDIPAELLKGSFVGHTAKRAEAIISYASGGVLYIRNYNTLVGTDDAFAGEAINAIATALNENTDVTIIIGDSDSDYIDTIRNVFTLVYDFPTYTNEDISQIIDILAETDGFTLDPLAKDKMNEYVTKNNSSIRDVQQIWANTIKKHISNFDGNEDHKFYIFEEDVAFPVKKIKLNIKK